MGAIYSKFWRFFCYFLQKSKKLPCYTGCFFYMYTPVSSHYSKTISSPLTAFGTFTTRLKGTVIFQISAPYMNSFPFCACWKLELCFVHIIKNCKQNLNPDLKMYDETGNYILLALCSIFQIENRLKIERVMTFLRWVRVKN